VSLRVVGAGLGFPIFSGRFTVKPTWGMFTRSFSAETWPAMRLGLSSLLTFLTGAFPSMVFYRFLYIAARAGGVAEMAAVMPVTLKVYNLIGEVTIGLCAGMLSSGAWAFAARRFHRVLWLALWAAVLALVQQAVMTPVMILRPSLVTRLWLESDAARSVCDWYMPIVFYANVLHALHETGTNLLLATNSPYLATAPIAMRGVVFVVGSYVFWLMGKDDPANVLFVFPTIDIVMFVAVCALVPPTLARLWGAREYAE